MSGTNRQEEIEQLRASIAALATGRVKQVQSGSHTVTFYDLAALRAQLKDMESELESQSAAEYGALPGVSVAVFDRR